MPFDTSLRTRISSRLRSSNPLIATMGSGSLELSHLTCGWSARRRSGRRQRARRSGSPSSQPARVIAKQITSSTFNSDMPLPMPPSWSPSWPSEVDRRRAAEMPTVDLSLRLVRSPRRRWLGAEGLALVGSIADEAETTDPGVRELREATAALAAELGEDRIAHERWTLLSDQMSPGRTRERALLAAARAAYELNLAPASRGAIERARTGTTTSAERSTLDAS